MRPRVWVSWLALFLCFVLTAASASAQTWEVGWWTADGGGMTFGAGGPFTVGATVGQPDAGGPLTGLPFGVYGGFWAFGAQADLSATKTDGQTSAVPGQAVTYTVVVANSGPNAAAGALVTDAPPGILGGVAWTCSASPGSSCPASGSGAINHAVDLLAGGTATFTLTGSIDPAATGTLSNTASVAAPPGTTDPNAANNSATDTDMLTPQADLSLILTDTPDPVVPGTALLYTMQLMSAGPSVSPAMTVVQTLPAEVTFVSSVPGAPACAHAGGVVTCTLGSLDPAEVTTVTVLVSVGSSATGTLSSTATVSGGATDPVAGNNSDTESTTLSPQADLSVSLSDAPDPVAQGGALTYTIAVANSGPSNSSGATLVLTIPPEAVFVSSNPGAPACVPAPGTLTCFLSPLIPGASTTVTVEVTPVGSALGTIVSAVSVAGNDPDPVSGNDADSEPTTVIVATEGELVHGSRLLADLAALPGPTADEDRYRIGQQPYSSYEVVLDGASGDLGSGSGPALERLASDGITVLQSSGPIGAGSSRSLRWENGASPVLDQALRVRSLGCGPDCGPEDVYRLRAYETTYTVSRFNSSGTQATALLLQNTTDSAVAGHVYFSSSAGALLETLPFSIVPHGLFVVSTNSLPGLIGQSGSIRVTHDGRYGDLAGKAVALEPATGFTFDTPLLERHR